MSEQVHGIEITRHNSATIPSYKFDCNQLCGNITEWGVDVHQGEDVIYTLDLQVWRPSPTACGRLHCHWLLQSGGK